MFQEIQKKQGIASNPEYSIWTSASAGSGKTTVLVKRLLRMFLSNIQPSKILCITFTNTGAAEMRNRINLKLAEWTSFDNDKLKKEIIDLEEGDSSKIDEKIKIARSLFAKILDYSNDFKILTIHSFCQQIIKRFPLEANIIPNFRIADEILSIELLLRAKDELLKTNIDNIKQAIKCVFTYKNEDDFLKLLKQAINQKDNLLYLKSKFFSVDGVINEIRKIFVIDEFADIDNIECEFIKGIDLSIFNNEILNILKISTKQSDNKLAEYILFILQNKNMIKNNLNKYFQIFLTLDNTIRKTIITKHICEKFPDLNDFINEEAKRVFEFKEKINNIFNFKFTEAFLRITYHLFDIYATLKKENGYLDYSDLIFETSKLLNDSKYKNLNGENIYSSWINYKLDEGLDHLLIDEAQDTSPIQWDIIRSITDEFFVGYGQKGEINRTIFVVGDEKQSIFSFQGAEPVNFNIMLKYYKERIEICGKKFENIYLETSFRSLKSILNIADEVFVDPFRKQSISKFSNAIKHNLVRANGDGKVEIWPLIQIKDLKEEKEEKEEKNSAKNWEINYLDNIELTNKQKLAETIANEIKYWFDNNKIIYSRKDNCERSLKYSDIMILVKNRDQNFINYLIRQFNKNNIPSMGNDKFNLIENIISQDLISLFKFILFNDDDLSLANIIKSPFFSMNEEELYNLCDFKNIHNCSLWESFKSNKLYTTNINFLQELIEKSNSLSIYELVFYIFETKNYRKNFKSRFPYMTDEILNEFIKITNDYEKNHNNATLLNFIYFLENTNLEIKRDMEQITDEIRIMTIHSSKGLESPIVILPDTNHLTNTIQKIDSLLNYKIEGNDYNIPLLQKEETQLIKFIKNKMKAETEEEYLRLLYVAITRSENELYICDCEKRGKSKENSWYSILKQAIENKGAKKRKSENINGEILYIGDENLFNKELKPCTNEKLNHYKNIEIVNILNILKSNNKRIKETKIINPSLYYLENTLKQPFENSINLEKGLLVHKLLEILPDTEKDEWEDIIEIYLKNKDYKEEIKIITLKILNDKKFSFLFAKNSQSEVPVFGNIDGNLISGKIDRLSIIGDSIHIVDYKNTNYLPQEIPEKYLKQLELYKKLLEKIYKDKNINCYILWTSFGVIQKINEYSNP